MLLALLIAASAHAGSLEVTDTWSTWDVPRDVEIAVWGGSGYAVVASGERVAVIDGTGEAVKWLLAETQDLAVFDADADGEPDLALCDAGGLWVSDWASTGLPTPDLFDATPCDAMVAHDLDGRSGVAVAAGAEVVAWWSDETGGLTDPQTSEAVLGGPPLLAARSGAVAAASYEESAVWVRAADGATWEEAGVAVVALAGGASGWLVAGDDGTVGLLGSGAVDLGAPVLAVAVADIDGDGVEDHVALTEDGRVLVVLGDGGALESVTVGDGATLAAGDLDADGCDEVLVGSTTTAEISLISYTPCPVGDEDRDGYAEVDGDCDDTDAGVHPGAPEGCDGIDSNCDGEVDEAGVIVEAPTAAEGEVLTISATPDGCGDHAGWDRSWSVSAFEIAFCEVEDDALTCLFLDDVPEVTITATLTAETGETVSGSTSFPVRNVAPVLVEGRDVTVRGGIAQVDLECGYAQLEAFDPGDDTVTWEAEPAGDFAVTGTGSLVGPDEGSAELELWLRDDDGGERSYLLEIVAWCDEDPDDYCGGYCEEEEETSGSNDEEEEDDGLCCLLVLLLALAAAARPTLLLG